VRTSGYPSNSSRARQWLDEIKASVGQRKRLVPEPENCALLVIDMNNYFVSSEGRAYIPAASQIVPNIEALIRHWRSIRSPVVYTRHGHDGPDDLGMLGKFFSDYIHADREEAEIIDALRPQSGDRIIRKKTYDAFWNTELESFLWDMKITQVMITGILTHMCCETTARTAFCRGFEVYTVLDATASNSERAHMESHRNMASCVSVPLITEEVLRRND